MNKKILSIVILAVVAIGAFYGGMKYGGRNDLSARFPGGNFENLSQEERQAMFQGGGMGGEMHRDDGFVSGKILSVDEVSVTVELRDGGSKIVFVSDEIRVTTLVEGVLGDLKEGDSVIINGQSNSDGSVTAETLQVVPEMR